MNYNRKVKNDNGKHVEVYSVEQFASAFTKSRLMSIVENRVNRLYDQYDSVKVEGSLFDDKYIITCI